MRSSEPIFGPAVPDGEEFEFQVPDCQSFDDVASALSGVMYDVLNGKMPQAKGEFSLRALNSMTRALIGKSQTKSAATDNQALGEALTRNREQAKDPELERFEQMAQEAEEKMSND